MLSSKSLPDDESQQDVQIKLGDLPYLLVVYFHEGGPDHVVGALAPFLDPVEYVLHSGRDHST